MAGSRNDHPYEEIKQEKRTLSSLEQDYSNANSMKMLAASSEVTLITNNQVPAINSNDVREKVKAEGILTNHNSKQISDKGSNLNIQENKETDSQ